MRPARSSWSCPPRTGCHSATCRHSRSPRSARRRAANLVRIVPGSFPRLRSRTSGRAPGANRGGPSDGHLHRFPGRNRAVRAPRSTPASENLVGVHPATTARLKDFSHSSSSASSSSLRPAAAPEFGQQILHPQPRLGLARHVEHDPALVQHQQPVPMAQRLVHRVGHHQRRQPQLGHQPRRSVPARTRPCRGSSAAVCSSSSRILDGASVAISSATACRCPPDSSAHAVAEAVLQAQAQLRQPLAPAAAAGRRPRPGPGPCPARALRPAPGSPRSSASAQVPPSGSWNTRAEQPRRAAAGQPRHVRAVDARSGRRVAGTVPASTLSRVDLPAPLLPITVTNSPRGDGEVDAAQGLRLQHRAAAESDLHTGKLDHRAGASRASSLARVAGRISAAPTMSAVTRLRSDACRPRKSASSASATTIR